MCPPYQDSATIDLNYPSLAACADVLHPIAYSQLPIACHDLRPFSSVCSEVYVSGAIHMPTTESDFITINDRPEGRREVLRGAFGL